MQISLFNTRPVQFPSKPVASAMQMRHSTSADGDSVHFSGLLNRSSKTIDKHGCLVVRGKHKEDIHHKKDIIVKRGAEITGNLSSDRRILLEKNAVVNGDVKADDMYVGEKAQVNGNVVLEGALGMGKQSKITQAVSAESDITLEEGATILGQTTSEAAVILEEQAKTGDIEAFSVTLEPGAEAGDITLPERLYPLDGNPDYMVIRLHSRAGVAAKAGHLTGHGILLNAGCSAKNIKATGPVYLGFPDGAAHVEDITTPNHLQMHCGSTAKRLKIGGDFYRDYGVTYESYLPYLSD